jgi:CubicO group peptidase (beta-lactamase class C family)
MTKWTLGLVTALGIGLVVWVSTPPVSARQVQALPAALRTRVDEAAAQVLASTGVPSLSVAIVTNGTLAYAQAYGDASTSPKRAATADMRYSIGSISKQFTATAILMLAEQGKLSLDDPVSKFLPQLTRSKEVTIRHLLSHTSGYQDYWPQDYVPPFMLKPISADLILEMWAQKPLDFEPGSQWQYSNTGYVAAGLIVEKASGMKLMDFLTDRIFTPLGMNSVADIDRGRLTEPDPTGYMRFALGPLRVAPKEGPGWLFAAGELAMTASDLARWDIGVLDQKLMKPASYLTMGSETLLRTGQSTRYGLGVRVVSDQGHRALEHGGEVSGFTAENVIYPDDRAAIAVLTNQDAVGAATELGRRIVPIIFPVAPDPDQAPVLQAVRGIFDGLQKGQINRALFTDNCNAYFTDQAIADMAASLDPLGTPVSFTQTARQERGGMTFRGYQVRFAQKTLSITVRIMPNGKFEQYQIAIG